LRNFHPGFDPRLYLVLDPLFVRGQEIEIALVRAIENGVTAVQLREKNCSNEEFISLARKVSGILKFYGIPLIINDRVDVALAVGADGVHLGQSDLHWKHARRLLGKGAVIGLSVETIEQVRFSDLSQVDYLGVGALFETSTKKNVKGNWGTKGLKKLRKITSQKLVAIGGIKVSNAKGVMEAGADGLAVISEICSAGRGNVQENAKKLRKIVDEEISRREGIYA